MAAAVVDGGARRRKRGIGESADCDRDAAGDAFLGVEKVGPADRAEAKPERRALVADPHVVARSALDLVGLGEPCLGGEHAAGAPLAGETMAKAYGARLALNLDAELAADAGGGSGGHARLAPSGEGARG